MATAMHHVQSTVLPNPAFEGSEKRLEIDFAAAPLGGLRQLPRAALDELMQLAACEIVSSRSNEALDAYVLSESSLFVYPSKWVLKTCGTTQLLKSVTRLLELTAELGMKAVRCKYTRASFLFPENQLFPHCDFDNEVRYLDSSFEGLLETGVSSVLGEEGDGLQWHVYVAGNPTLSAAEVKNPIMKLEICMTELGLKAARQFFRDEKFISTQQTTVESGIRDIKPTAIIDDYVFEPCGYSMNGIDGASHMTIHITPEPGFSYASLELAGDTAHIGNLSEQLSKAISIFQPDRLTMALSTNCDSLPKNFGPDFKPPAGYTSSVVHSSILPGGGCVNYVTMVNIRAQPASPKSVLSHQAEGDSSDPESTACEA